MRLSFALFPSRRRAACPAPALLLALAASHLACGRDEPAATLDLFAHPHRIGDAAPAVSVDLTTQLRAGGELKLTRDEANLRAGLLVGGERGYWIVDLPAPATAGFRGKLRLEYRGSADGELRLGALLAGASQPQTLADARSVQAGRWQQLEFELDGAATPAAAVHAFTLHPPAAEVGETALRQVEHLTPSDGRTASLSVGGVRRRALLVPTERQLEWELRGRGGDRLELGLAPHPDRSSAQGITMRLSWRQAASDSLLLERHLPATQQRWQDFDLLLPGKRGADGQLLLQTFAQVPRGEDFVRSERDPRGGLLAVSSLRLRRAATPPNVLLLVIDTLRADGMGSFGNARDATPHLDAFVERECVRFDQATATATWTHPSLGSILSGLLPQAHGLGMAFQGLSHFRAATPLLAERLRAAGYATAAVTNNLIVSAAEGFAAGYDSFDERPLEAAEFHGAARVSQAADEWLSAHGAPFHLYLHYFDPHDRYQAPAPWTDRFVPSSSETLPTGIRGGLVTPLQARMFTQGRATGFRPSPLEIAHLRGLYDGEIGYTDQWIGWLLERMRERGQLENTLLILVSDHGEEFLEHERLKHGHSLYEELLRVPLAIRFPDAAGAGQSVADPVSLLDLLPTILAACGLSHDELPGADLRGRLDAASSSGPVFALAPAAAGVGELPSRGMLQAVRESHFKLIREIRPAKTLLFDLRSDPAELHDVAAQHPETLRRLLVLLDATFADAAESSAADEIDPAALEKLRALGYAH